MSQHRICCNLILFGAKLLHLKLSPVQKNLHLENLSMLYNTALCCIMGIYIVLYSVNIHTFFTLMPLVTLFILDRQEHISKFNVSQLVYNILDNRFLSVLCPSCVRKVCDPPLDYETMLTENFLTLQIH